MNTLTVLYRVRREIIARHGYPICADAARRMRVVVVGICTERWKSGVNHLAALTAETPESVQQLIIEWRKMQPQTKDEWRRMFATTDPDKCGGINP